MLNADPLLKFISVQTGAEGIVLLEMRQLTGGAIQENYGLKVHMDGGSMPGERHFVVRCDAPASLSVSLSRSQEFQILQVAHAHGVQAPRPYWLCTDKSILGSEFYIMQWAPGSASPRDLTRGNSLDPNQSNALVFQLGQNLARLHQIKSSEPLEKFLTFPQQGAAHYRIQSYRQALDRLNEWHPAIELGLLYLESFVPDTCDWALCHGDFRTGNYLVSDGEMTAILDWEFASFSDPYEDLGWLCSRSWRFGRPECEVGGVGDKTRLFEGYESISGKAVDPKRVVYWELMATVRWAVIALEQMHRHVSGQQKSLELALTGHMLPEIQLDIMRHLRDLLVGVYGKNDFSYVQSSDVGMSGTDHNNLQNSRPDCQALLDEARSVLLNDILPNLPSSQLYNARMVANAMVIAARESRLGKQICTAQQQAIAQFYQNNHYDGTHLSPVHLAQGIRQSRFEKHHYALFPLIDLLLSYDLLISNPKKINTE